MIAKSLTDLELNSVLTLAILISHQKQSVQGLQCITGMKPGNLDQEAFLLKIKQSSI